MIDSLCLACAFPRKLFADISFSMHLLLYTPPAETTSTLAGKRKTWHTAIQGVRCLATNCEECVYCDWDEETGAAYCTMDLDEDEMERFLQGNTASCSFYRRGDDYTTARRQ